MNSTPHTENQGGNSFWTLVTEQLAEGQAVRITLGGKSMWPTLSIADKVTVTPGIAPKVGDMVLFRHIGRHVLHRLVRIKGDTLIAQGDNNYGVEEFPRRDLMGVVTLVERKSGRKIDTRSAEWRRVSHRSLCRKRVKNFFLRWLGRTGRQQLRPWYFLCLAILMWAPLTGIHIPLNNYVLGLRLDHLLHASVFIPCSLFLMDWLLRGESGRKRRALVWLCAVGVGIVTESVQYLLPYRGFDINDMIANFLGISLGWGLILWGKNKVNAE